MSKYAERSLNIVDKSSVKAQNTLLVLIISAILRIDSLYPFSRISSILPVSVLRVRNVMGKWPIPAVQAPSTKARRLLESPRIHQNTIQKLQTSLSTSIALPLRGRISPSRQVILASPDMLDCQSRLPRLSKTMDKAQQQLRLRSIQTPTNGTIYYLLFGT